MYNQTGYANVVPAEPTGGQNLAQSSGLIAQSLDRPGSAFGAILGPAAPLLPSPIDPVLPDTGRAEPRRYEYQVAANLNLNLQEVPWNVLKSLANGVDIIARAITIRTSGLTKMDWSFTLSDDAITEIMAEQNVSHAKAAKIGRDKYGEKIAELTNFFENPYPDENRGWTEFLTEWAWNLLTFDGSVFYPRYTLGGKLMGFDIIDPSTIKILLDNYGRVPVPPAPAYQQILWGFPRGEFVASPMSEVDGEYYEGSADKNIRPTDSLAYFVRNRRTWTPYGFSEVEQAIPAATLYLERQNWLVAEYQAGSMPQMFMETDAQNEVTPLQLAEFERIFNDKISGSTAERHRVKVLPAGFKPSQVMSIDEKYKADYDEWIVKKIASIFGVAPSQLGVVARAGLGGGKGAHDGEEQSAETVSAKPIEKFIVECVNSLCKRFLNMDNSLTFVLEDKSTAETEDMKAKAAQTTLFSGIATLNDVRGEMGLPLYDMPEADEPFIVAGNAIQFLKGQLAVDGSGETLGQKEAPLDQATPQGEISQAHAQSQVGEAHPQGQDAKGQEGQSQETSDAQAHASSKAQGPDVKSAQLDELKDFTKFVKARHKRGNWRSFDFGTFSEASADKLNEAGYFIAKGATELPDNTYEYFLEVANLGDTPKGLVTKRGVEQTPGYDEKRKVENKHRAAIALGLAAGIKGVKDAITQALSQEATDPNHILSVVNLAVTQNVKVDAKPLADALRGVYTDASSVASQTAADALRIPLVKQGAQLTNLLSSLDQHAGDIQGTTLNRIRTAIVDGMSQGNSARDIGTAINQIINDPARADMIAVTETNTSYNAASIDTYQAAGAAGWNWVAYDGACEECLSQAGFHDISDTNVPSDASHPSCRCGIEPELTQPSGE
jgi:hypothetical protein